MADLHIHTSASDGTLSPSEVVETASSTVLAAIAVTDHDTVSGVEEALSAGREFGIEVVPGVEISTVADDGAEVHILGYFIDHNDRKLNSSLDILRKARWERARKMVVNLNAVGVPISFDRVKEIADGGAVGRPHVARAIWEIGAASSLDAAFGKFLVPGRVGYVPRYKVSPFEAVRMILDAGGVPCCGHVAKLKHDALVLALAQEGLAGIEVYHPDHGPVSCRFYERFAKKHGLVVTGGSDFHGYEGNKVTEVGSVTVPYETVARLRQRAQRL